MLERNQLQDAFPPEQGEDRIQRMWETIDDGRHRRRPERLAQRRRRRLRLGFAACTLSAVAAVAITISLNWTPAPNDPGPLLVGTQEFPSHVYSTSPQGLALSDGSTLSVEASSRLELLENSGQTLALALRHGATQLSVVPGGPRTWRIEAGDVIVEVVGTQFRVARSGERIEVQVTRGAVLVRGDRVPDGVQRLGAGDQIVIDDPNEPALESPETSPEPAAEQVDTQSEMPTRVTEERPSPPWQASAAAGEYADAYEQLGAGGMHREVARAHSVTELMALADVARLSGHPADAIESLERIVVDHPGDARASVAAYWLAQVRFALGSPQVAAEHYALSIRLGLPGAMRESALARRVQALASAGDPQARAAAEEYLTRFPEGRYRTQITDWTSP